MLACPSCGKPSQDDARFCSRCGARVPAGIEQARRALVTVVFCSIDGTPHHCWVWVFKERGDRRVNSITGLFEGTKRATRPDARWAGPRFL